MSTTVLVAEPDVVLRAGLEAVLRGAGLEVDGAAGTDDALALARARRPDAAVLAADLPGERWAALTAVAAAGGRSLVLSAGPTAAEFIDAVRHGARGYLGKDVDHARLPTVVRAVARGESAFPRRYGDHLVDALQGRDPVRAAIEAQAGTTLSEREWDVLRALAAGRPTGEVALELEISAVTVRRHVSTAVAKLGLGSRAEAVALLRSL